MPPLLIIAGDNSGEKYGADLVSRFLETHPETRFFGIGGRHMQQAGVELLYTLDDLAMVGVFEIIAQLPRLRRIFQHIKHEIHKQVPAAAVLIDSPDFNLRVAKVLKRRGIPVLYYISPTVWAWRRSRLRTIKNNVSKMMLIFPFESDLYAEQGISAVYVGHPLIERVKTEGTKEDFCRKYGIDPRKPLILLLPGSRRSEIRYHLSELLKAVTAIRARRDVEFALLLAENLCGDDLIPGMTESGIFILDRDYYQALHAGDLALSACGTANLEAALLDTPVIAFYRISPLTYALGKPFVKISNYSIVNILAGESIIPELIQKDFTAENLSQEAERILASPEVRSRMLAAFDKLKMYLGNEKASANAARELSRLIQDDKPPAPS